MAKMIRDDLAVATDPSTSRTSPKKEDHESDFLEAVNDANEKLVLRFLRHTRNA